MSKPIANREVPAHQLWHTGFSMHVEAAEGGVLVRLQGELDMATASELGRTLALELDKEPDALAIDLTELSFVDSSGIGALVGASRRAQEGGCSFVLRSPTRAVRRALELTGVDRLLEIEDGPPAD